MRFYYFLLYISTVLCVLDGQAQSGTDVKIGDPDSWIGKANANMEAQPDEAEMEGVYYLLIDRQTHVEKEAKYFHCVYRITSIDGLQENADINVTFDPGYERITFHEINIIREGVVHNQLHPAGIKVVQNEQQMDRYLYDNSLTAIVHLQDLRVGDIVAYSYTRTGFNPVFDGHYSEQFLFQYSMPYEKGHFRVVSPKSKKIYFDYKNGVDPPSTSSSQNYWIFTWDFEKMKGLRYAENAPSWYMPNYRVFLTDFKSWEQVNHWAHSYYSMTPGEKNKLRAEVGDYFLGENKEATALNVIRFVQDEVRYLGFEDGIHSHKPHPPLQVFKQRYGDCKDKSMLLCALLACYDIDASPVLVNATLRHTVRDMLPAITVFDHVVAQIVMQGDTAYIDPTISNQGGVFGTIYFPSYDVGYVIHPENGGLHDISQKPISKIEEENMFTLRKIGEGANLIVNTSYFGVEANIIRHQLAGTSQDNLQQSYTDYYANLYPTISSEFPMKVSDDRDKNILQVTEYYEISEFWETSDNRIVAELYPLGLDQFTNIPKSTQRREAPYQLNYPTHYAHETIVRLPEPWAVTEDAFDIQEREYSYAHQVHYSANEVRLTHTYQTHEGFVPAEHIDRFVKDHQSIRDILTFQLFYDLEYANIEGTIATPAIVITIIGLIIGFWFMIKLYRYDPDPGFLTENQEGLPIGGWLVLFAIGVIVTPLVLIYQIFLQDLFFNPENWVGFMRADNISNSLFMIFQLIYNLFLLLFSLTFAILFFKRRSTVPKLVWLKYVIHIILLTLIMLYGTYFVEGIEYSNREWFDIIKILIGGVIWIWYFNVSQRVSNTFLTRRF